MVSLIEIVGLALVDAVNPCALAVMAIVLMALLLSDPMNRRKVLFGGLAFVSAVFLLYFVYGVLMVFIFQKVFSVGIIGVVANYVFKGFGLFAIVLGLLNLKDYFNYKPGSFGTEMPMRLRPRVKILLKRVQSVWGAFFAGMVVTVFLLPCTIGPYVIASGRLASLSFSAVFGWLLLYNLVFVLPMLAIALIIYLGITTVEKVSGWKDSNIRMLHLVQALILICLGILMFTGLI